MLKCGSGSPSLPCCGLPGDGQAAGPDALQGVREGQRADLGDGLLPHHVHVRHVVLSSEVCAGLWLVGALTLLETET